MSSHPPLIILCAGRSYSSVVSCMLGQHPSIFAAPELNLFQRETLGEIHQLAHQRGLYSLHGLVRSLALLHDGEQSELAATRAWAWIEAHADWSTAKVLDHLRDCAAPAILVDKSPTTAGRRSHLGRLIRAAPDARILHLTRHPLSVGQSLYRVKSAKAVLSHAPQPFDAQAVEEHWIKIQYQILDFTAHLPAHRHLRLQGEWLVEHPIRYLEQICRWLGIDQDAEALAAMLRPEQNPFAHIGPANARFGNNVDFLKNPRLRQGPPPAVDLEMPLPWFIEQRHFSEMAKRLARQFGYQ